MTLVLNHPEIGSGKIQKVFVVLRLEELHDIHSLIYLIGVRRDVDHRAQAIVDQPRPWIPLPWLAVGRLLQVVTHRYSPAHLPHC